MALHLALALTTSACLRKSSRNAIRMRAIALASSSALWTCLWSS